MSKFEKLSQLFSAWASDDRKDYRSTLVFYPDGTGRLSKGIISTVLEFDDIDEVIAYLDRRVKLPPQTGNTPE